MTLPPNLATQLGDSISDPETETFLLFSQPIPSQNLGFVDKTATELSLSIGSRDLSIAQSPTLLSSNRPEGTTGAVTWKITPLFASWLLSPDNILFRSGLVDKTSTVLELGCGSSSILPCLISPYVGNYIATDLPYIINGNLLQRNFASNSSPPQRPIKPLKARSKRGTNPPESQHERRSNVEFLSLDWETSIIASLPQHCNLPTGAVDVVIACDCIYNETLIAPFVQTCVDLCRLKTASASTDQDGSGGNAAVCVVAQQLRSDVVFEEWLRAFCGGFRVWRVPDELLSDGLGGGGGFCVHVGLLREDGGGVDE